MLWENDDLTIFYFVTALRWRIPDLRNFLFLCDKKVKCLLSVAPINTVISVPMDPAQLVRINFNRYSSKFPFVSLKDSSRLHPSTSCVAVSHRQHFRQSGGSDVSASIKVQRDNTSPKERREEKNWQSCTDELNEGLVSHPITHTPHGMNGVQWSCLHLYHQRRGGHR